MAEITWEDLMAVADAPEAELEHGKIYDVVVEEAEFRDSKNDDPQFRLVFEVVGGPNNGRKIWHWITAASTSSFSQKMFVKDLRTLLGDDVKVDITNPNREEVAAPLHGRKARVEIAIEKRSDTGELRPNVKKIFPAEGASAPTAAAAPSAPSAPAAPAAPAEEATTEVAPPPAPLS